KLFRRTLRKTRKTVQVFFASGIFFWCLYKSLTAKEAVHNFNSINQSFSVGKVSLRVICR
ncbi:MAG: hypothetical protein UHU19_15575, partial [Lachnospiraceae bacterium]|nr:hypothetical protein [Lachnospiraceae bacterium]